VEQSRREAELEVKLAVAEKELADLKAMAGVASVVNPLRRTVPRRQQRCWPSTASARAGGCTALDAALSGLSLEQRIAVKTQLARAGSIA